MTTQNNQVSFDSDSLGNNKCPVYLQYPGQFTPQLAFIEMDETGQITADSEIGNSVSGFVWHNRTIRFSCPDSVLGSALKEYLINPDTIKEFQKIHDLHEVNWDGSNHVGYITDNMRSMIESIESELEQLECCEVWEIGDYIENSTVEDVWGSGDTLEQAITKLINDANNDNIHLVGDIDKALNDKKNNE